MKKNFINYTIYQLVTFALPIILNAYVSRTLGVQNIGMYNLSLSVVAYFSILLKLGIDLYGSREVAYGRSKGDKSVRVSFEKIFQIQLLMGIFAIFLFLIFSYPLANVTKVPYRLLLIQGFGIIATLLDISWLVIGLEKFNVIIVRNTLIKVMSIVLVLIFVKNESDLILYTFIIVITNVVASASVWPMMRDFISVKFGVQQFGLFKPMLVLFLPIVATSLFTQLDTILVGQLSNFDQVSFYAMALSIISIPKILVLSFGAVAMPHVAKKVSTLETKEGNTTLVTSVSIWLLFSGIVLIYTTLYADDIVLFLYGKNFSDSANPLIVLSIMFPFYVVGNIIRTQILIPRKNDKPYTLSILFAAVINVISNILLVPKFGAIGGAIAMVITEITIFIIEFLFVIKMTFWKQLRIFIVRYIILMIFLWFIMYKIQVYEVMYVPNILIRLILNIILLVCLTMCMFPKDLKILIKLIRE